MIGSSHAAGFQIAAKEDDVLMYKMTFDGETSYAKFTINQTIENSTAIVIFYNGYFAENLTGFNETDVGYSNSTLTGNVSHDLLESGSILNLILPMGTNFSKSITDLQDFFNQYEDITAVFSVGSYGYSINIAFYVRLVLLVKVMELTYYYSTTGVLLLEDYYFKNPNSKDESSGIFEILPEYSTVIGADENPYDPANISGSNSSDDGQFSDYKKFQMDKKGIITIVLLCLAFFGLASLLWFLIKRKRKLQVLP
ncbi:MAG: hypothetical protein ACTSWX_16530 [Promethearchaeota archaeon]